MNGGDEMISIKTLIHHAHEHGFDASPHQDCAAKQGWHGATLSGHSATATAVEGLALAADGLDPHRLSNNLANTYRRRLLAGGYVIPGEMTVVAGAGGYGKTMWVLLLLLHLTTGMRLLDTQGGVRRTVAFISLEEPRDEVFHKLRAIKKHCGIPDGLVDNFLVYGNDDPRIQALTVTGPRGQPIVSEAGLAALDRAIAEAGADVVAIDCLAPLAPVGANDNGLVYTLIARLKAVLQRHDCGFVLIAHTRKGANEDTGPEAVAGASAWVNGARVVVWIKPATAQECEEIGAPLGQEKSIRKVSVEKANFMSRGAETFVQMVGVTMHAPTADYPEDSVGVIVPFKASPGGRQYPPGMLREMVEAVALGSAAGPFSPSSRKGARSPIPAFMPILGRHIGLQGDQARSAAQAALGDLIARGWLDAADYRIGPNKRQGLRVVWSATLWASDPAPPGAYVA